MNNLDDDNDSSEIEEYDEHGQKIISRRRKVILTGVFVENEADMALDKLTSMKSGRF